MILIANLLGAIALVLHTVLRMLIFVVFINALLSWVNPDPMNPIVRFLNDVTRPLLKPIRRYIPLLGGRIDISPIILLLAIFFLDYVLVQTLSDYAYMIRQRAL